MMSSSKPELKNAIVQILSCALQPHSDIQRITEERKKALEMTEDYPFILLEIIRSEDEAQAEKLMAAIFLKNYFTDSRGPTSLKLNAELKQKLCEALLELIVYENDAIRSMISACLGMFAVNEYPKFFTVVNNKIIKYLLSENVCDVKGATQFIMSIGNNYKMFCNATMYFPTEHIEPLLNILQNEAFSPYLRMTTINCLIQILVSSCNTVHFTCVKTRLIEIFKSLLMERHRRVNYILKAEIINGITQATSELPTQTLEFITICLPAIGQLMYNCSIEYKSVLMGQRVPMDSDESEPKHFYFCLHAILVLINGLFIDKKFMSFLMDGLNDFLYLLIIFMAPQGKIEENLFLEEEVESTPETDFTLRGRSGHTLMLFMDGCDPQKFFTTFHYVLQKHINDVNAVRGESELYYNRITEALMFAVGLISHIFDEPDPMFPQYVEQWSSMLMEYQANENVWILFKRLLWLGGRFSRFLSPVTLNNHLSAIFANYNTNDVTLKNVRLDALRSHLSSVGKNSKSYVFLSYLSEIMDCLLSIPIDTPCRCMLRLESLAYFFQFSPKTASGSFERIFQTIVDSTLVHMSDNTVINKVKFALSKIVINPACKDIVQKSFIPFTMKLIYKDCFPQFNLTAEAPERGFDLLNIVIMFHPGAVEDEVVLQGFLAGCNNILESEDSSVVEVVTIFLSNLLVKASYQIKTLSDSRGKALAQYIIEVLFKLLGLNPQETICPSKFGRFCVISIMTLPEAIIEPCIEPILKAVLSALQRTEAEETIESYCFIFAYMFMWQTENAVNFLSGIPGPDGLSALSYFLNRWSFSMLECEKFEKSIITLAICKMIEYSLTKNDNRINDCRIQLEYMHADDCMGLEKLYLCLVKLLLYEVTERRIYEDYEDEIEADVLIKNQPICNLNLVEHIKTFLTNFNTQHYYHIVKTYIERFEHNAHELEKMGIYPTYSTV